MEAIFDFIDDLTKRLNRPIKDLDDIRYVMAALKEIRESEIRIDMVISPIEVRSHSIRKIAETCYTVADTFVGKVFHYPSDCAIVVDISNAFCLSVGSVILCVAGKEFGNNKSNPLWLFFVFSQLAIR